MSKVLQYLPELDGDEQVEVARVLNEMNDRQAEHFARIYRSRRRDPTHILLLSAVGFAAVAGLQRIYLDELALGLVYLFTGGLCLVGTIYDIVNYEELTLRYNRNVAVEAAQTVRTVYDGDDESKAE